MNTYNGVANGLWSDGYRAINMVNIVLEFCPFIKAKTKASLLKGECLFIRTSAILNVKAVCFTAGYITDNSHQHSE